MNPKSFYLAPNNSRKSFYGKAIVKQFSNRRIVLQSYTTDVCAIEPDGRFVKLWNGYSATTMAHINAFIALYGIDGGGKNWWVSL